MYLSRMELQGFKTFAQKTTLVFPAPKKGDHAVTVVVGPNGSGKSNIADAIRWCLGEQSMKLLRGKAAQDVIFSGAEGRGRSGFAEVSLTFDNSDHVLNVSFSEVVVTRRLYRDGESEYLLNGSTVRLADIQLLLADAGVGQRSYSVIGQGMIDHVLAASPEDRKVFFDDATGVRGFQIKRHQALLKLQKSAENLADVEMVLRELEPRLNMLRRQVKKLNDREAVAAELATVSAQYFGVQWWNVMDEKSQAERRKAQEFDVKLAEKRSELATCDLRLATIEAAQKSNVDDAASMQGLQMAYKKAQQDLADARRAHFAAERDLELAKVKSQTTWAPLPLPDIIAEVRSVSDAHASIVPKLRGVKDLAELVPIIDEIDGVAARSSKLRDRLTRPNPEDFSPSAEMLGAIEAGKAKVASCEAQVRETELAIDAKSKETTIATNEVFVVQREIRALQQEVSGLEAQANAVAIDIVRCETRLEGLKKEMEDAEISPPAKGELEGVSILEIASLHDRMLRLRHQLELIGGIEETVMKEYQEADERFTFLSTQVTDLRDAIASTEKIIDELDEQIREQSDVAFKAIATEFQKYFAILFGGGRCSLVKLTKEELDEEGVGGRVSDVGGEAESELVHHEDVDTLEAITKRVQERKDAVVGIDIQATPPGKRLKALNLLSGGERALTSIALVSAIMATNPAPFVILDEVDAALDEANTVRFANILNELRKLTQFIVITHNRATMEKADMLYGVTMGDDGVSKMLSVKLEDYVGDGMARR